MDKLPTKLGIEPLVDVIFEVRFSSNASISNIIPGILYSQLKGDKSIERLNVAEIPKPIRDKDPNLTFAPLVKINWGNYNVSIGDRSILVSCNLPYQGWKDFKSVIHQVISCVQSVGIIQNVHRFSMKYVDLLPAENLKDQISKINASVTINNYELVNENFSIRFEMIDDNVLNIVNIITTATATLPDGSIRNGLVVDVDTITHTENTSFDEWYNNLDEGLELIHGINKKMFFNCMTPEAIESLEPTYD